jgi:hypothetical protein
MTWRKDMAISKPITCKHFIETLGLSITEAAKVDICSDIIILANLLENTPDRARRILLNFVEKSPDEDTVFVDEFADYNDIDERRTLYENVKILNRYGLAGEIHQDMENNAVITLSCGNKEGWSYWGDIKNFCEKERIPLRQVIIDLDFAVFDGKEFINDEKNDPNFPHTGEKAIAKPDVSSDGTAILQNWNSRLIVKELCKKFIERVLKKDSGQDVGTIRREWNKETSEDKDSFFKEAPSQWTIYHVESSGGRELLN